MKTDGSEHPASNSQDSPRPLFGDYELLAEIARGGMGVVYRARQISLNRTVAVKMILAGHFAGAQAMQRFRGEAEAAAALQHPNIVAIHEVGEHEGRPYFTMDYVEGKNLAELARENPLPAKRAAAYLKTMAEAIQYAHDRGILHRDLKPSNVLIDAFDQPRVTDFGLAKRVPVAQAAEPAVSPTASRLNAGRAEESGISGDRDGWQPATQQTGSLRDGDELTLTGQVLGSPNYLPPEQAGARGSRRAWSVGLWSDAYGLGAILYHLMTGRPPFHAETPAATLQQVLTTEPLAPRLLNPGIPRDLETICLKCLEKDPSRRFASAQLLAEELGRFLKDEPIRSRPISPAEKAWRWCQREPVVASLAASLALAVILGFVGVLWQLKAKQEALTRERHTNYQTSMNLVAKTHDEGNVEQARTLLRALAPRPGEKDLRGFDWYYFWRLCRDESQFTITNDVPDFIQSLAVSPDGVTLAYRTYSEFRLWHSETGEKSPLFRGHNGGIRSLAFSPDGLRIASAADCIMVWDARSGDRLWKSPKAKALRVECVRFSRDGQWFASGDRGGAIRLFDSLTYAERFCISDPANKRPGLAFSPDNQTFAFSRSDGTISLWDLNDMAEAGSLIGHAGPTVGLDFSPDGSLLASASSDGTVKLCEVAQRRLVETFVGHKGHVSSVVFSPNGKWMATGGRDATVRLWDVQSRKELRNFRGHTAWVNEVAFFPDGSKLASCSDDHTVKIWRLKQAKVNAGLSSEPDTFGGDSTIGVSRTPVLSSDGKMLATGKGQEILLWDVATEQLLGRLLGHTGTVNDAVFSPDGTRIASASDDQTVRLWDVQNQTAIGILLEHTTKITCVAFSHDGRWLASVGTDRAIRIWNSGTRDFLGQLAGHTDAVGKLVFTRDNRHFLSAGLDGLRLWDLATRLQIQHWTNGSALSPDGKTFALKLDEQTALLWDVEAGRQQAKLDTGSITYLEFSADGQRLVTADTENTIQVWDISSGKQLRIFKGHSNWVYGTAISPDGKTMASVTNDGQVKLWNLLLDTSSTEVATLGPLTSFPSMVFSRDGLTLASRGGEDRMVRLWRAATREEASKELARMNPSGMIPTKRPNHKAK